MRLQIFTCDNLLAQKYIRIHYLYQRYCLNDLNLITNVALRKEWLDQSTFGGIKQDGCLAIFIIRYRKFLQILRNVPKKVLKSLELCLHMLALMVSYIMFKSRWF